MENETKPSEGGSRSREIVKFIAGAVVGIFAVWFIVSTFFPCAISTCCLLERRYHERAQANQINIGDH